jgi:hypothetical protein
LITLNPVGIRPVGVGEAVVPAPSIAADSRSEQRSERQECDRTKYKCRPSKESGHGLAFQLLRLDASRADDLTPLVRLCSDQPLERCF